MKFFTAARLILSALTLVSLAFGLQGCSGGGGGGTTTATPPAVNTSLESAARGYYEGFATINVSPTDLMITSPNFKAIVDEKQFVIAFVGTPLLLYKGTFTEVTATTFKADIRVYKDGAFLATATINNGTITAGTSFKGTISGTGDYVSSVGDIELTYNAANNLAAKTYNTGASKSWQDSGTVTGNVEFTSNTNIMLKISTAPKLGACLTLVGFDTSNIVYAQTGRIRSFSTGALSSCATNTENGKLLSGYFTNYNGNSVDDDRMLFIASDNDVAYVGILPCGPTPNDPSTCFTP